MELASGHNLAMSFGTEDLFRDISFSVESNARIGLVGRNGAGKSTLFRIITGELAPTEGQMVFSRDCRLAYMEQFLDAGEEDTLYTAVGQVFAPLRAMEQRLQEINAALSRESTPALLSEQSRLQEAYGEQGGYNYETRLSATLLGLGFRQEDFTLPIRALSGGQRSKAALAKILLSNANLILLDEPTNHLDIESVQWLETFLASYKGALLVISHDRYFLDKVTTETWDLHHRSLHRYKGNYSRHLELRAEEEESLRRRYQNQMKEIHRVEGIIEQQRRFNQARNYVTIASKEKQIARLQQDLVAPESAERSLSFRFNVPPPGGNDVLIAEGLSKGFAAKPLFRNLDMHIRKGERIFLLGANGCGKTTLMKILLGRLPADRGMARLGVNIRPVYYDQLHHQLDGRESILTHFTDAYPRLTQTEIRSMLGRFLFPADAVEKTLDMLSGGEKARLELMKLMLEPANFLLLDEPTNHLDIDGMEAIEAALEAYPGTMLVISHDRYLINKLADRIYLMQPDGLLQVLGNYDDLQAMLERQSQTAAPAAQTAAKEEKSGAEAYRRRKEEQAAARKREKQLREAQADCDRLEQEMERLDAAINDPAIATDYQRLMELVQEKEQAEAAYLQRLEELEALEEA